MPPDNGHGSSIWKVLSIALLSAVISGAGVLVLSAAKREPPDIAPLEQRAAALEQRAAIQETKSANLDDRLKRIEDKLDRALDLMTRRPR